MKVLTNVDFCDGRFLKQLIDAPNTKTVNVYRLDQTFF